MSKLTKTVFAEFFGFELEDFTESSYLVEDLGLDDNDIAEFLLSLSPQNALTYLERREKMERRAKNYHTVKDLLNIKPHKD